MSGMFGRILPILASIETLFYLFEMEAVTLSSKYQVVIPRRTEENRREFRLATKAAKSGRLIWRGLACNAQELQAARWLASGVEFAPSVIESPNVTIARTCGAASTISLDSFRGKRGRASNL